MRAAMFMAASSWNRSLAAYGMWTCAILVLFLHGLHSKDCFVKFLESHVSSVKHFMELKSWLSTYAIGVMSPQTSQMWTLNASDTSNRRSFKNAAAP